MAIKSLDKSSLVTPQTTNSMLAGYSFQDYELIESVFLASPASSVTFNNLNQYATDYKHLQVRYVARSDRGTFANDIIELTFNQDSTVENYKMHVLWGGGSNGLQSGVNSLVDGFTPRGIGDITATVSTAGNFGAGVIDILDAYNSKNKTTRSLAGFHQSNTAVATYAAVRIALLSHLWMNTSSITSINIRPGFGTNLVSGSRFSLYGIR
jgi:hypothetical protein